MKNLKKLLIVITVFTMATASNAQILGIKAGLNLSNLIGKAVWLEGEGKYMKPGYHFGVTTEFAISKNFVIEPGLLLSTKGFRTKELTYILHPKFTYNFNYIEIPINFIYKIDLGNAKVLISAGYYFSYAISGKVKANQTVYFSWNSNLYEEKIDVGNKEMDQLKPFDSGVNMGVGIEINKITIGIQYGLGLPNISAARWGIWSNGDNISNRVIGISAGYKFGKR